MKPKRIFLSPPFVGEPERRAVERAFDSGYVAPCGPMVDEFERRLAALSGRSHAVAVSSGTAALDLLMEELAVGPATTVIAPTLTFIATVGPAWHRGAKLVFVDSTSDFTLDLSLLEQALKDAVGKRPNPPTSQPPASSLLVLAVDLYGRCCDYDALAKLCRRYGAKLILDSAEAVGATYKGRSAGDAGIAAVYSFNGNKIITTSGGGAIVTDSKGIADRARKRSQQSREPFPWYQHKEVGYNYRMSNILAAIGLAQLERLPSILKRRAEIAAFYAKNLPFPVETFDRGAEVTPNHWLSVGLLPSRAARDRALAALSAANVEARPVWKPLHLQPVFRGCRVYGGAVAKRLFERGICLPSGTGMTASDLSRVVSALRG